MKNYKIIDPWKFKEKPFEKLAHEWMLITAGNEDSHNTMTAAWGGYGVLWSKPVVYTFIRPSRYTYGFAERHDRFTLTFFSEKYKDALKLCGTVSGRDRDKIKEAGLTPLTLGDDLIAFEQAELIITAKKAYFQDLDPGNFLDTTIPTHYNTSDYHRMYIGNVEKILVKEK